MSGTDSPWWTAGRSPGPDSEDVFKYPPELLGTSWGSYLFSVPPTATAPGRSEKKVIIAEDVQAQNPDIKQNEPLVIQNHDQCSPKRSILRTPACQSNPSARDEAIQPHPLFHRLASSLQKAQEALKSCGINSSPLSEALTIVNKTQHQAIGDANDSIQSCRECIESVLKALVCQAKRMEEYAISLQHTAAVLSRNQRQFTRDHHEMQQMMETAFSHIMFQKKSLEEKKEAVSRQNICQKPHVVGLREGQHKLALAQTRKEHLRLEKALLQQQRELKKLEEAYRTTKSELAAEHYSLEKLRNKLHKSDFNGKLLGTNGIRKKFQRHSQHLHQLECQLEASRQELLETGSKLQREERDAHIPLRRAKEVSGTYTQDSPLNLPSIAVRPQASNQPSVSDEISLPKLCTNPPTAPLHVKDKNSGPFSCSELMELAKFRSPEVAEQVISWLEKGGHLKSKR